MFTEPLPVAIATARSGAHRLVGPAVHWQIRAELPTCEEEPIASTAPAGRTDRTGADRPAADAPLAQTQPLLLTKLRPPAVRSQWVARNRLLERLRAEPGVRLTALIAPAGSGKTTLLTTWLDREEERRPIGWVSLDEDDNDPVVLWSHALESLRRVCPGLEVARTPGKVGAAGIVDAFLPDLVNGLSGQGDAALVLDDLHRLRNGPSRDSVAWLVEHAPPSFQLVISSRTEPPLGLPSLRAHGELLELRAGELEFDADEAASFFNDCLELELGRDEIDDLLERTEGWATGLYLAALSLRGTTDRQAFVKRFGGGSRHVVDFLVDEVLEAHDAEQQNLMLRCSVLERLCGPLCDALLEQDGSAGVLAELARTNLFLRPLDDHGQWYRFHSLFRQLLRVELEHREPGLAQTLHRRAYAWHRDHGSTAEAIGHALEAGAFAEAGDLIAARWVEYAHAGRHATVLSWLERFPQDVLECDAALVAVKAWALSLSGQHDEATEAMEAAERLERPMVPLPDGFSSIEASLATLQAYMPWGDVRLGLEHARRAAVLCEPGSPQSSVAYWAVGKGLFYTGEFDEADAWFAQCADLASLSEMWTVCASSLAHRSLIAGELGRPEAQRALAERAAELLRERGVEGTDGAVPTALATSLAALGQREEARRLLEQGVEGLRSRGRPIGLAHALIQQARVLRALGADDAAAAAVAEARATVDSCPDPGVLEEWLAALERPRRDRSANESGDLSERERTVLRALTGPLSERDIARELFLSHNTVHSHARSIYRKLGASSRKEAVLRGRELGLL